MEQKTGQIYYINHLEFLTIEIALQELVFDLRDCQILLQIDNITAIAYVNKFGSTRYEKYNSLARRIWQSAGKRNIFLYASYISSKENIEADVLSRIKNTDEE